MRVFLILLFLFSMAVRAEEPRQVRYGKTQACDVGELLEYPDFKILCQSVEDVGTDRQDMVYVLQTKSGKLEQVMRLNNIDAPIAVFRIKKQSYQFEMMSPGIKISRRDK